MFVVALMGSASYLSFITRILKEIQRQGTGVTIWLLEIGWSHTKLNSRRKPTMILSGLFIIQEPLKATGQWHHTSMSSRNVVRSYPRKVIYIMKNRRTVSRTHKRKNEKTGTIINEINCGGIGTLKWLIIYVLLKGPPILTMYDVII